MDMEAPLHQSPAPPAPAAPAAGREQCPRCASRDTKFCYYNNYNTAQPRHFCRACRRYWTLGGSLRNVPIGGSTRKRPRPRPRPRPATARAAAAGHISGSAALTTTATSSLPSSPALDQQSGLLASPICSAPLLEGSAFFGFDLGKPGLFEAAGLPLLWPAAAAAARVLKGDVHQQAEAWKVPVVWQELAAAAPMVAGGLHHAAPQLM